MPELSHIDILGLALALTLTLALFVWASIATARLFSHFGEAPWKAWAPILNLSVLLSVGGFPPSLALLALVPVLGWVALAVPLVVSFHRIGAMFGQRGSMTVVAVLGYPVWASVLAWGEAPDAPVAAEPAAIPGRAAPDEPEAAAQPVVSFAAPPDWSQSRGEGSRREREDIPADWGRVVAEISRRGREETPDWGAEAAEISRHGREEAPGEWNRDRAEISRHGREETPEEWNRDRAEASRHGREDGPAEWDRDPVEVSRRGLDEPPAPYLVQPSEPTPPAPAPVEPRPFEPRPVETKPLEPRPVESRPMAAAGAGLSEPPQAPEQDAAATGSRWMRSASPSWTPPPLVAGAPAGASLDELSRSFGPRPPESPFGAVQANGVAHPDADPESDLDHTVLSRRHKPMWTIIADHGVRSPVTSEVVILGRSPVPDAGHPRAQLLGVNDPTVSKTHARLEQWAGTWLVVDLNSTNGVTLVERDGEERQAIPGVASVVSAEFYLGDARLRIERSPD